MNRGCQFSVVILFLFGWAWVVGRSLFPSAAWESRQEFIAAVTTRRTDADQLAETMLARWREDPAVAALAAEVQAQRGGQAAAIELLQRLPRDGGQWEFQREFQLGQCYESLGEITAAEGHYRRTLELNPQHLRASERLGHLLQFSGRSLESAPYFFQQVLSGKCRGDELVGMATGEQFFRSDERLELLRLRQSTPESLFLLGEARRLLFDNRTAEAEALLRTIVDERPDLGEAQGRLGRIIVDRGDLAEFLQWRGRLTGGASDHPEVWFVQGLQASRLGQNESVVRCCLETLQRAPNHLQSHLHLSGALERLGRPVEAAWFAQRGEHLSDLDTRLNQLRNSSDVELMRTVAALMGKVGRYWEAAGWCYVITQIRPDATAQQEMRRWLRLARADYKIVAAEQQATNRLKLQDFPLPRWPQPPSAAPPVHSPSTEERDWDFVDVARDVGINFQYFEGTTEERRLEHIFNTMGSGFGVIDFDLDYWPDLYLAQANNWRDPNPQPELIDPLYRNRLGERFEDVTRFARLNETGFSHGVVVGDVDQDGMPDVYIGNKGPNTLYLNQGDGTFRDATVESGVAGQEWSTSAVFADFNQDGLPDLYVLNYSLLQPTADKECRRSTGEPVACTPSELTAETDRLYLNLGDGTFRDVSVESGVTNSAAKGLGVIVWDFEGEGRLGIFVANDTMPNMLWTPLPGDGSGVPKFREDGIVRGVAFDSDGHAPASMGVAASDATGDGLIDLFVTTFFGEAKVLFCQDQDGFFQNSTRPQGLRDPGFWMLGFGCQFADFDADGWDDLVVANGHVDQTTSRGTPDRMPPQLFRNEQGQRFREVPRERLGAFFQHPYLGRGLAKLDWNRDGRIDFAVANLHAPFALVSNRSPQDAGHQSLMLRLVDSDGARDPIGARITVSAGDWETQRLITGGDGFLVTNERGCQVSVPLAFENVSVAIQWPNGRNQFFNLVPVDCEVLLESRREDGLVLRRFPREPVTRESPQSGTPRS
ncbi:MAG: FG-GAP-like repeat-containing protein [Planctomycetaceae bacterium]|nr:FG-GAP-like repeat-containing protein [Planctomycetaceae bacterium]